MKTISILQSVGKLKAIKVNADYESVLFKNKPLPRINEALEFLAFFIDERPVLTMKKYSDEYLNYIESLIDRKPQTVSESNFENWWGPLKNLELERKFNSKEMSSQFCSDTLILNSIEDLPPLHNKIFLAKNPFGMSGQNFSLVEQGRLENLEQMLRTGPVILEPFFERVYDFSHYIFPNGISICYENLVDKKFQYRGTIFRDYTRPALNHLKFYSEISESKWNKFSIEIEKIKYAYTSSEFNTGYSVDSFIYREKGELNIRAVSEINYRRTMGQVAFELSLKFGGIRCFSSLLLAKSTGLSFKQIQERLKPIAWRYDLSRGVVQLSPGQVRYDMFFLSAMNESEGDILLKELGQLLPESNFYFKA